MQSTPNRLSGSTLVTLAQAIALNLLVVPMYPDPGPDSGPPPGRECASDYCPRDIPGPVTDWPWTDGTHFLRLSGSKVELDKLDGSVVWTVPMRSDLQPGLVAAGDFTGDGVTDFIFDEVRVADPPQTCAGRALSVTQLVFVDGATGAASRPVPPTLDLCWGNLGYATHQWGVGTAYIGHFMPVSSKSQVVLFPYYATVGSVLEFTARVGWRPVHGKTQYLAYPSTSSFDSAYNAANATACSAIPGRGECYVEASHVPNAVFLSSGASQGGLLVLTSMRAVIYRPDFTPTSDLVWSYREGSGRNYGLLESHDSGAEQMVTLIGGCSVAKTRDSMRLHQLSDDPCGLQHHYEWFLVKGQSIAQHSGRFFGWAGSDGPWQNRLEFPFPSSVPLTGGSLWSVFNLYSDGRWWTELLPNPADPNHAIEIPGWYVWGTVSDLSGHILLAATRTAATRSTAVESYVPPWEFDFLRWEDGGLVSIGHYAGVVPSLVLYPPGPSYHVSDGDTFGLVERRSFFGLLPTLLVETLDGTQSYLSVPESSS